MRILIKNGIVLDMSTNEPNAEVKDILIQDDKIIKIEKDIQEDVNKIIDAEGKAVIPGLVNCHNHSAMSLFRGYSDDVELMEWLNNKIWPVEDKLTKEHIYYGSLLSCIEMIKSGTTIFNDMYWFMEETAKAATKAGIRAVVGRCIIDGNLDQRIKEAKELYENYNNTSDGTILVNVAAHAPYTCNPETLKECVKLAKNLNTSIHIHLSETQDEQNQIKEKYGKTPTEYLEENGVFEVPTILAHGIHLSDSDLSILKKHDAKIVHNPISNLKLASGIADIVKYRKLCFDVGIGTDGAGSTNTLDMFEEMRVAAYMQKVSHKKSSCINAYDVLKMATIEGAKVLNLDNQIGTIEVGKKADIVIVDLNKPHMQPLNDVCSALVYSSIGQDVCYTIVNGKIVMENRKIVGLDENEVIEKCNKILKELGMK